MLHDDKAMDRIADKVNKRSEDDLCGGVNFVRADEMMREYAEHQAAPLEARILALEEALAVAHKMPYNGKVFFATKYGVPVHKYEPHPLLADRDQ